MEIISREVNTSNWITMVILFGFILLASAKLINTAQFSDFSMLFSSNKYLILYQKGNRLTTVFNAVLTLIQVLSVSLFLYILFQAFDSQQEAGQEILYFKIFTLYLVILTFKILIEKIIGTIFSVESIINEYLFYKISYRNFLGMILLPLNVLFIYVFEPLSIILQGFLISLLILNLFILFSIYKKNEKLIINNLFYFILYLCALEIAPYFMLYRLIV